MRRRRTFIESEIISSTTAAFAERGFTGASVGDLVRAIGVSRASLYGVSGPKDEFFRRCLTEALAALNTAATPDGSTGATGAGREDLDLILVTLVKIAPGDLAVYKSLEAALDRADIAAETLDRRLLAWAGVTASGPTPSAPTALASPPT